MFILLLLLIQRTVAMDGSLDGSMGGDDTVEADKWCVSKTYDSVTCPDSCAFTEAEAEACYDDYNVCGEAMRSCYDVSGDPFACSDFKACGVCCSDSVGSTKCAVGTHVLTAGTTCTLDSAVQVSKGTSLTISKTGAGAVNPIISGDGKTNHFNVFGDLTLENLILQDGINLQFDGGSINAIRIGAAKPSVTLLGTTLKANKASKKYGSEKYDLAESKNPFNSPGRGGKSDLFSLIHKLFIYLTLSSFLFFFFLLLYFIGAIALKDAILHLKDGCEFLNNRATYGGAIAALVESEIKIEGAVLFKNNIAADPTTPDENLANVNPQQAAKKPIDEYGNVVIHKGKGGAILLSLSTLKTVAASADVTFESNTAVQQGSAIDIENKDIQLIYFARPYTNSLLAKGQIVYSTQEKNSHACFVKTDGTNPGCGFGDKDKAACDKATVDGNNGNSDNDCEFYAHLMVGPITATGTVLSYTKEITEQELDLCELEVCAAAQEGDDGPRPAILKISIDSGTFVPLQDQQKPDKKMVLRFNNGDGSEHFLQKYAEYKEVSSGASDLSVTSKSMCDTAAASLGFEEDAAEIVGGSSTAPPGCYHVDGKPYYNPNTESTVTCGTNNQICLCCEKFEQCTSSPNDADECASQTFDPLYYKDDISYVEILHGSFSFKQNRVLGTIGGGAKGTGTIQMNNERLFTALKKYGKNTFKVSGSSTVVTMDGNYAPVKAAGVYINSGWTMEISNGAELMIKNGKTDDWEGHGGGTGK